MLGSKASFGESLQGAKSELRASMALPGEISLDVSTARYSDGYRELTDALNKDAYEYQSSSSANIAWNHNLLGTFSLGYYTYQATDNDNDSRSIMASWAKHLNMPQLPLTGSTLLIRMMRIITAVMMMICFTSTSAFH